MIQKRKSKRKKSPAILQHLKKAGFKIYPKRNFIRGRKNEWLSSLRKIIGKSQTQLAAMVGVSPNTIANIETGRSPLKHDLALKINAATGVSAWHYLAGDDRLLDFSGQAPYSHAEFENWRKNYSGTDEKRMNEFFEAASDSLNLIFRAAIKCGSPKNHLPALRQSFYDWCDDSIKYFQLKNPLDEILKEERKFIDELTMRYRDWRRKDMVSWQKFYGFKNDPKKSGDELLTLQVKVYSHWRTCGNMKVPPGGTHSARMVLS
jgi:transcriptional regulator with XRE-family HTH domain